MQKTLFRKEESMMKTSEIETSCERRKISLTYQFTKFRKNEDMLLITMYKHQNNKDMF